MPSALPQKILETLQSVLPWEQGELSLHEPCFAGNEWNYVKECLDTGWVSSVGRFVDRFEAMLAEYTGSKRAVAVVNGTAALHIALKLIGVGRNDEVLLPALTFVATANAVSYCGAVPHFVDSEEKTLGMTADTLADYLTKNAEIRGDVCFNLKTGRRIRAALPMHTFGHPVDLDAISALCKRFHLEMVEDAAESLGSFYKGEHTGTWGRVSVLSFNGNKIITTGGGGALITNDESLADLAKHLTTTAKTPHRWAFYHDTIGYNYRLPNINAALGCAQLEQLPDFLKKKRSLSEKYQQAFDGIEGVRFFTEPDFARSNYWLNVLLLDENRAGERDAVLEIANSNGLKARPAWTLLHKLPMYKNCPRMDVSVAESLESRLINIPSSACLGEL
ncbi:MAG: LegC family aminotransferase [bacterium]